MTTSTTTETVHEAQERRAAEFYGLRPSAARICPRVVAGKHCLTDHGFVLCVCQRHQHLLDHGRIWLDQDGRHVLAGEPYDAAADEVVDLIADLSALGLRVSLTGRSLWNPARS
jgi:hypothetical protein